MAVVVPAASQALRGAAAYSYADMRTASAPDASGQGITTGASAGVGPAYRVELSLRSNDWNNAEIRRMKQTGQIECQTCKARCYQDGSNDPGVSFKAPAHVSPQSAAAVVLAHEQEHVSHEQANAANEGRRVVSQTVRLFTAVCPECGRVYVSGGETRTVTAADSAGQEAGGAEAAGDDAGQEE